MNEIYNEKLLSNMHIPTWEKVALTIKEAAEYSNIGENELRRQLKEPGCEFALSIGNGGKTLIKRKEFEKYISNRRYF